MPTLEEMQGKVPLLELSRHGDINAFEPGQVWIGKQDGVSFVLHRFLSYGVNETADDLLVLELEGRRGKRKLFKEFKGALGKPSHKEVHMVGPIRRTYAIWDTKSALNELSTQ
ncbi:MAG: hypothetical protein Q7R49_00805 [Candidatus Daviesbacteria bacterium]|nr:hypothetical protein [Candidatus Daviesbacteria bacterium]